jgi:uncharacterized protein YecT (DUF1311 family)
LPNRLSLYLYVRVFFIAGALALPALALAAQAPLREDRAAVDACLKDSRERPEACIEAVYDPCSQTPEGQSTPGMEGCAARELAVWDEKLNAAYRRLVDGDLGKTDARPENRPAEAPRAASVKGAAILADMEKSWIAYRVRRCDALALTAEGGTLARTIYSTCYLDETARQALFLESLSEH